jgi:hypothetical protein
MELLGALLRLTGSFSAIAYGDGRPASRQACSRIRLSESPYRSTT